MGSGYGRGDIRVWVLRSGGSWKAVSFFLVCKKEENQKIHLLGHMCCKSCFGFADYVIKNDICNEAADQINSLLGYNDEVDSVDTSYYKEQIARGVFNREVDNKLELESEFVGDVAGADDLDLVGEVLEQEILVKPAVFKDVPPPNDI